METEVESTEEDLLLTIACYGGSESRQERQEGEAAFNSLIERHQKSLNEYVGASVRKYRTFNFDHEEMYFRIVEKIWRNAEHFKPGSNDSEVIRRKFLAWASSIRENLFNDAVAAIKINFDNRDFDEIIAILPEDLQRAEPLSEQAAILAKALATLSDRDQDILRSLAENVRFDGKELRSNPDDLKALADRLDVTVPSLTTMRKRSIERLKAAVESVAATT